MISGLVPRTVSEKSQKKASYMMGLKAGGLRSKAKTTQTIAKND
jgi:DNA-binding protein Fis